MVSSLLNASLIKPSPPTSIAANKLIVPSLSCKQMSLSCSRKPEHAKFRNYGQQFSYSRTLVQIAFQKSVIPLAASLAVVFWSNPAHAGFLSGFSGIESVPGPELPKMDFLTRFNDDNQKKYAENDARFKDSPILKELLEKSKLNKEKNKQQILDKYCLRGAEWGVGDCSTDGMSPDEKDKFIAMLKLKAGVE